MTVVHLAPAEVRSALVGWLGLDRELGRGAAAVPKLLDRLEMIQLDPLDRIGTNADLVAHARVGGLVRGDVARSLMPGHAFEHFAKEQCLLPARVFPRYRERLLETPWWRHSERMARVPADILDAVEQEIRERGPLPATALRDRGACEPMDWSGWRGTSRLAKLAVDVLWTRCRVVTAGRTGRGKIYDVPERALGVAASAADDPDWRRQALLERARAAGMLPAAAGPWWGLLEDVRQTLPAALEREGALIGVELPGSRRRWWSLPEFVHTRARPDGEMRVIAPLDPLLWDRELIRLAFGFDYTWEVYKPAARRRWGYYVVPVLQGTDLIGRFEGHREGDDIVVDRRWVEPDRSVDEDAYARMLDRLRRFQGLSPDESGEP